jgi:hypothetical protein
MEENKEKKCCEHGGCENCMGKKEGCCYPHKWSGKCHMLKFLILILLIIAAVCFGMMIGSHRGNFRERGDFRSMMDYYGTKTGLESGTGSVTVKVLPPDATTNGTTGTTTPPVTQ